MTRLFICAAEQSGDLHGEKIVQTLYEQNPDLSIFGILGPRMRAKRAQCVMPMEKFEVMGFVDVFWALPKLLRQFYSIANYILRNDFDAVVTIDYPGFNLRLAKYLRKKGYKGKLIHFICPSVWAWGKKRIPLIAHHFDLLLSILPFEKKLFEKHPLQVSFVGHPLIERLKSYPYQELPRFQYKQLLALFPGSRKKEIERNLPLQLDVCKELKKNYPHLHFALSIAAKEHLPLIEKILSEKGCKEEVSLVPSEHSYELMKSAHLAIAKSGTVTLELALHHVPTVVIYSVSKLDKIIAYDLLRIRLPFYCLVNIIAEGEVFPELIGPNLTYETLKKQTEALLQEPARTRIIQACRELKEQLGSQDTADCVASEILKII